MNHFQTHISDRPGGLDAPFDIAADLETPVSAWRKLTAFDPVFLLESVAGGDNPGRYSFLGLGAALRVRLDGDGFHIGESCHPRPASKADLLARLRQALGEAPQLTPAIGDLPFGGGLVGATGYDVVRHFERLPGGKVPDGTTELSYVAPQSLLVFDHLTRRASLLHAGNDRERLRLREQIVSALNGPQPGARPGRASMVGEWSMTREDFTAKVEHAREYIAAGDIYQLVLSMKYSSEHSLDPFEVYRALRLINPSSHMFYIDTGEEKIVGSSPEALVTLRNGRAALRPIAGTRPRGQSPAEDDALAGELRADPKEMAEHTMLVDLARNDLGRVAEPGSIEVGPDMIIERYSHVMHLVSGVEGRLEAPNDMFDLFAAAFPAGTLVGAPKIRAMELIDALEPEHRGWYGGAVGYFGHDGRMDQAIAIRTIVFKDWKYTIQAGAGIVADSSPEGEYAEIQSKLQVLKQALNLAQAGL
ncbi:anthranilate synthase component I family protein [Hyphobacterium sp. HN65]|uniref:Anthranilate synthase component 1 n=1 Tax=Hyphobacterium lacteum TaxID=3116575 RepID=A0ABU7LSD9_9PROT|nr:anthranilate synthase component I family protein [Hyphobacterium sp. HN65]MEE2526813.1 anthranilate synthase component I family protein [Hyphobacterium sp. HN65]